MYVAFVISNSNSDTAHFGEVKRWIKLMEVRSDPANPHTRRLLPSKDPHRIVILKIAKKEKGGRMKEDISVKHLRAVILDYLNTPK